MKSAKLSHSSILITLLTLSFINLLSACASSARVTSKASHAQTLSPTSNRVREPESTRVSAVVKSKKVNLRRFPSRSSDVIAELSKDEKLILLHPSPIGPWYRVQDRNSGTQGWIHGNVIALGRMDQSIRQVQKPSPAEPHAPRPSERSYINVDGERVPSPVFRNSPPQGASARCRDGSYSFSRNRRGTCSHHGGVAQWL